MSKITKFFDVYGMKCHSCEVSVEHEINELNGITNVSADHENSMVIVTYDDEICDDNKIKTAIKNCGFSSSNNLFLNCWSSTLSLPAVISSSLSISQLLLTKATKSTGMIPSNSVT